MKPSHQVRELATTVPGATADELLHKLLANLTALLGARRAYITEIVDKRVSRTIAGSIIHGMGSYGFGFG